MIVVPLLVLARKINQLGYISPASFAPPPIRFRAARQIYPYSIIPGGVYEPREMEETIRVDQVAREHYSDIRQEFLVPFRVQAPMLAYVSFRKGNKIYWTSKKMNIPRGELLLTDGKNLIRARCGNRISAEVHAANIVPQDEDATLETVFETALPSITELPPSLQPVVLPGVPIGELWKEKEADLSSTPEPATIALYVSGISLICGGTWLQGRWLLPEKGFSELKPKQEIG